MRLLLGAQARALRCAGPARHILTPATSATSRRTGMLGRGTASSAAAGAADGGGGEQQTAAPPADGAPQFRIVSEEVVHKRYLAL